MPDKETFANNNGNDFIKMLENNSVFRTGG
jgi:hypothetical protein